MCTTTGRRRAVAAFVVCCGTIVAACDGSITGGSKPTAPASPGASAPVDGQPQSGAGETQLDGSVAISDSGPRKPTDAGVTPVTPVVADCSDSKQRGIANPAVRRLSLDEIRAVLADVYAPYGLGPASVELDAYAELPEMSNVDEFSPRFLPQQVRTWSVFVDSMQQMYDQNSAVAVRAAGACANEDPVQESCWSDVIGQYGRGLLRRPLFDDERELLVSQVRGKNLRGGLPLIVGQLLRSPEFMFHVELGGDAEGDHVRLTGYEVANRIAFATIGTGPDAALKDAIDRDELRTLEQVAAHVRRLLADPRAQDKLKRFFAEWFGFSRMKAPDYAYVNDRLDLRFGGELKSLMTHELVEFAHHVIWKEKGTFHDLMTRQIAFPRNETMRKVFDTGAIVPDGSSEPIEVQHHAGLGVRPGMMLNSGWETSPILRGAFVLNRLLCAEVPPPDFTQVAARFDALPGLDPVKLANYEVTNQLTHVEPCWTCHQKINPMGFIYEGFDPIGMRRTEQKVWKSFYELATTHPIPLPIENLVIEAGLPTTFANPIEFAAALAESDKLRFCMSTYLFRHMQKRKESQADSCAIEEMVAVLREGRPVLDMFIKSIANEDVFWRRSQ